MRCSKCGMTLPDDSVFCSGCGAKIKRNVVICQKCGAELPAGSEFCNHCGTAVFKAVPKKTDLLRGHCPSCGISLSSEQKYCPKCKERNPIYIKSRKQGKKSGSRKKLIVLLSAVAVLLIGAAIAVFGFVIPEGHFEFDYELINNGENYVITGYKGNDTDVVIPEKIWGKRVNTIARYAFQNNDRITSVYMHGNVNNIGVSAFEDCDSLESVYIGGYILDHVDQERNTKGIIMENAFRSCNALKSVTFDNDILYLVLDECFSDCTSLEKMITYSYCDFCFSQVGERAFSGCKSLQTLDLSCKEIGAEAFKDCTGLVSAKVNVPAIPEFCFENCSSLEKFVGRNIDTVGAYAFSNCTKLSEVIYEINEDPVIFDTAYDGCTNLVIVPKPQNNPYAGSNLIGMTKQEMFDYLGYNYELKNVLGGLFYLYDQYGLSIPVDEESVYINSVYVYGDQYVSSMEGATDHIRIGMTIGEIFDIVGELPISADMMTGGYFFSIEQNGYCCQFITRQTDDEILWGLDGTITFNKTDALDDVVSYCLIYRMSQ